MACSIVPRLKTLFGPKDNGMSSKCCSQAIKWHYVLKMESLACLKLKTADVV